MIVRIRALSRDMTMVRAELGEVVLKRDEALGSPVGVTFLKMIRDFGLWMQYQLLSAERHKIEASKIEPNDETIPVILPEADKAKTLRELANIVLPPKVPGRPSHPEDDWAWEQVNTQKRPRETVRAEWLDKMSEKRRDELKDIKRSFRHAIDPERRRKE